jgi:mannose-6-phosphate isomerase
MSPLNPISLPSILKFEPIYKEKIWGGEKLRRELKRDTQIAKVGESWEISDYENDVSQISPHIEIANRSFRDFYQKHTNFALGTAFTNQSFPLLIKIIDANDKLSVQVHPDDAYALAHDPSSSGKKECWLVLSADVGAELVIGFENTTNSEQYKKLVLANQAEKILRRWKVKAGDVFLLNPGTIHAIGAGVVLLEVQQSSDSTYRVYDYGRLGDDGKPRALHLEKALSVLNFQKSDGTEKQKPVLLTFSPFERYLLTSNDKFRLESWKFNQAQNLILSPLCEPVSFGIVHLVSGTIFSKSTGQAFTKGDTVFLTAQAFLESESFFVSPKTEIAFMSCGTDWARWLSINN